MLTRLTLNMVLVATLVSAVLAANPRAAAQPAPIDSAPLIKPAAARFSNLTRAERALLDFADKSNPGRGEFAVAGTSAAPLDPSNDPADAGKWSHDRDIRAGLIRWLAVDNTAMPQVDPNGLRVLGARIVGPLDLAHLRVPFAITLIRCSIPEEMNLESADLPAIDLDGSYTGPVNGTNLIVRGNLSFGRSGPDRGQFNASGLVVLSNAKIEGSANFNGGHFRYSEKSPDWQKPLKLALMLTGAHVTGDVNLGLGFESQGCAFVAQNVVGADLNCWGGRFMNPGNVALTGAATEFRGSVFLGPNAGFSPGQGFEADGMVRFENARVANNFFVENAKFGGATNEPHGFSAPGISVVGALVWQRASLQNGAIVDLSLAKIGSLLDQEQSWPQPGNLLIDGFSYELFAGGSSSVPAWTSPVDATSRLRWLSLQQGYHPQPYRQLAKVLRASGDDAGAIKVLIAAQDARYSQYGLPGRMLGWLLKVTIGYGHRPMLALLWSLAVVLLGSVMVLMGKRAGVMRPTWPENKPSDARKSYEELQPLLYSLDVFLPFVNLHQEHYWWPDATVTGDYVVLGRNITVRGRGLRYYLWLQIVAGWLLSAIFIAGVTGLMRND